MKLWRWILPNTPGRKAALPEGRDVSISAHPNNSLILLYRHLIQIPGSPRRWKSISFAASFISTQGWLFTVPLIASGAGRSSQPWFPRKTLETASFSPSQRNWGGRRRIVTCQRIVTHGCHSPRIKELHPVGWVEVSWIHYPTPKKI